MLYVRPTRTSNSYFPGSQLVFRLRAGVLISAVTLLCACAPRQTLEELTVTTDTTEASSTTAAFTPVAMIEPETGSISELPEVSLAEANPAAPVDTGAPLTISEHVTCSADADDMQQRMLQLIKEARSQPRMCGDENFSAAGPLSWNTSLAIAAQAHSDDMAEFDFFSHTGSDGSSAADRVAAAGYLWRNVGENIAAGRNTAANTVTDWLESPGHCSNIMNPAFFEVAVSCSENNNATYLHYWTNVLAAPR